MSRMLCPSDMDCLFAALGHMTEKSAIIAGGTDLTIKLHEGRERPDLLLNVLGVKEMRSIEVSRGRVEIGAAVNFSELADSGEVREKLPALADAASTVGSKQIRNRGTIAGNVGSASPAGDMLPVLLLYGASLRVAEAGGAVSEIPFSSMLGEKGVEPIGAGRAIISVLFPVPRAGTASAFLKLGSRRAVTIAKLSAALSLRCEDGVISGPSVTLGAVARRPVFARRAIEALEGKPICAETAAAFGAALSRDVEEAIPGRYSLPYKRQAALGVAADLFMKIMPRAAA